jgi:hypothetical protein
MNRESQWLEAWAAQARQEPAPRLDVAAGVLQRIQARPSRRDTELPWLVFSGLSLVAASLLLLAAGDCWQSLTDPLAGLFSSLTLVMQ